MKRKIKVTYVQMFSRPEGVAPPPPEGVLVLHSKRPTIRYFRFLYDAVGRDYDWTSRKKLSDDALAAIIHDPRDELHVLFVGGVPAGFVELDRRVAGEVEIDSFGLTPEFIGRGLGRWFLRWAVERAWGYGPKRLWLHTCSKDHPAALPNYLKAGFAIYREAEKEEGE
jgi:GNAT superfamily N-acetyltransferase